MTARSSIYVFVLGPIGAYALLFAVYLANPVPFHFRAYELLEIFTNHGFGHRQIRMREGGDSSREYLFQKYSGEHTISMNEYASRPACFDPSSPKRPRVLMSGDSQLYGSGVDDAETLPSRLCSDYGANAYNGGKVGLVFAVYPPFKFDSIVFTTTERRPLSDLYCLGPDKRFDPPPAGDWDFRIKPPSREDTKATALAANTFLHGFLGSRVKAVLNGTLRGFHAPDGHVIGWRHGYRPVADVVESEVACARSLAAYFEPRGTHVGFMYFPAHQTIYAKEGGIEVDAETASFIDRMTTGLTDAGLRTMNSKECLLRVKDEQEVYQLHDTHLAAPGYAALSKCIGASPLAEIMIPKADL